MPTTKQHSRKLVIAFDAESLADPGRSGVGYYTKGLVESLAANYDVELIGHYFNFLGRRTIGELPRASNIRYVTTNIMPAKVPNMLRRLGLWIPFELFTRRRADFHLFPAFIGWPSLFGTGSAPVIHDTAFLDHPNMVNTIIRYDLQKLVPREINRARFIVTISGFSASRLQLQYNINDKPIVVGHIPPVNATILQPKEANRLRTSLKIPDRYVFFIGNIEPRKNLPYLIEAFTLLAPKRHTTHSLVLAGGKGWLDEHITQAIDKGRLKGFNILTPGYVDDQQRAALFMGATVFATTSTYEGFGMPLLEAMYYGVPILASNIPAHKEAAGNAAVYCNPTNPKDIAQKLKILLQDSEVRGSLVRKGTHRLKGFSWKEVTAKIFTQIEKEVS